MVLLDVAHQVQVPLEGNVWVVAALNENLDRAQRLRLVDLGADLLERQRVPFLMLRTAVERAKAAVGHAHVRVVDVAVHDVRDDAVRVLRLTHAIRLDAKLEEGCVLVEVEEVTHLTAGVRSQESGSGRGQEGQRAIRNTSPLHQSAKKGR